MLRRHEARKLDYMRYVEHELNLESLRALRTKRMGGNRGSKKKAGAASDFSCVRLARWIFDRAVVKFPADVDLWLHYIEFAARQGQSKVRGVVKLWVRGWPRAGCLPEYLRNQVVTAVYDTYPNTTVPNTCTVQTKRSFSLGDHAGPPHRAHNFFEGQSHP